MKLLSKTPGVSGAIKALGPKAVLLQFTDKFVSLIVGSFKSCTMIIIQTKVLMYYFFLWGKDKYFTNNRVLLVEGCVICWPSHCSTISSWAFMNYSLRALDGEI